jgi:hypothetical protein
MRIRDVREEDAEAIAQLITEFTQLTTTAAEVQRRLARSQGIEHPVLAELDGNVAGFASLRLVEQFSIALQKWFTEDRPYRESQE